MASMVGDGPRTFRVASLAGGACMVLMGFFGFLGKFFTLSLIQVLPQFLLAQ